MIAVVMVNECAGLGPSDVWYWIIGCWALPYLGRLFVPIVLAFGGASLLRRKAL